MMFFNQEEVSGDEDDVSAEKETESEGAWFSEENEHCKRKKGIGCKKVKRKKETDSLGHIVCGLFLNMGMFRTAEHPLFFMGR